MTTVLIVNDDAPFRRVAGELLDGLRFQVVGEARNGEQAIAAASRLRPDAVLPALTSRASVHVHAGEFATAAALIAEADAISDATARGEGRAIGLAEHASALLHNGLGQYPVALAAARRACEHDDLGLFGWSLAELVEAGARADAPDEAPAALAQLEERTGVAGTSWALGMLARSREEADACTARRSTISGAAASSSTSRVRSCSTKRYCCTHRDKAAISFDGRVTAPAASRSSLMYHRSRQPA